MEHRRSLDEWLAYLEQLHPTSIDMGLDRCREVAARLGLSRPAPRVITVTGTNGKGSTCAFIARLLRGQDLSVGVYASPHLLRYNERVQINDETVGDAVLCEAFAAVEAARGPVSLTYFEMGTLAAFWIFERARLDFVVLEVGLGGRLDAVNLADADLAVVTSIGLDHAEWLGNDRESVAFEKAGIFRPAVPAVCGEIDPPDALLDCAAELQLPLYRRGCDFDLVILPGSWNWRGLDASGRTLELLGLPLLGLPMENAAVALQVYALLGLAWSHEVITTALVGTRLVGRLDRRAVSHAGKSLTLLFDVGHNPHAAQYLSRRLQPAPGSGKRQAVFGLLSDKDLAGVIEPLLPLVAHWCVTPLPTPRSRAAEELADALAMRGASAQCCDDVASALDAACDRARPGDEILVFGSFYSVAEGLGWLARH